jgi:hypothetical protein
VGSVGGDGDGAVDEDDASYICCTVDSVVVDAEAEVEEDSVADDDDADDVAGDCGTN